MSYGHAERNLDAIRAMVRDTEKLLRRQGRLTAEQRRWLRLHDPDAAGEPPPARTSVH